MRVFVSYSKEDAEIVRGLQQALESRQIEAASMLDVPAGELRSDRIEQASCDADAFIFMLGPGASANPWLQAEWTALLRNDWDGTRPMIPVLLHGQQACDIPRFLKGRKALVATNCDELAEQIEWLLQNLDEARQPKPTEKDREEQEQRLEELRDFAESLKAGFSFDADTIQPR